ncbi:glycosyl hydrolase family 28-related protein [Chitinophaga sp. sic0106]|uniref:glycosyl hydrolase family 28-related protein n=1 Tax=Chitinophaga sp. sic0106 TaxID=2854785 RepID=UPI001C47337B|nr:glycosyl hydrolase family 28-related protein [Chitinophaga sp. sic0106]MBV7531061.1 SMP-30/gluconolactonase/LRE family protein [Chitinophaga sp. sic0106]
MKYCKKVLLITGLLAGCISHVYGQFKPGKSFYTQQPEDPAAVNFTPKNSDGSTDVTEQLQQAINQLKKDRNFGTLLIPEGTYKISKTIYIPGAIRVIGYGKNRPTIVLAKNSPGFQEEKAGDKGKASYMFWFTSSAVEPGGSISDAGAGTFYSALSNVDLKIEDGNPHAVALRTHFAQHSFVAHININIGKGKAGLFEIGNFMEDVQFFGGEYGIYTTKASPGWQFMMMDTYFEGQRRSAIKSQEAGFTIVRMQVKNVPAAIQVEHNYWEKIYLEDSRFENISGPAITLSNEGSANMQLNIRNLNCSKVPVLVKYPHGDTATNAPAPVYTVQSLTYGLQQDDLDKDPVFRLNVQASPLQRMPAPAVNDVPALPAMATWYNLKESGAKGDGVTDDTKAIQQAIDTHPVIFVPQGSYRITETIHLKPNTVLIGLHPMATNFALAENSPAFGGFGAPKAMIEAPAGGTNIITGIGLYTGTSNYRAVACKWMAGATSMVDDVKLIGGHGTMRPGPQVNWKWEERQQSPERRSYGSYDPTWDTQYWSMWVTNNGGGIFKNIWSADTYATNGFYADHTSTRGRIYALSVEHHVRNEVRFNKVSNWKVFALQLEEESVESSDCQPLELTDCHDMTFANLYMFRVIRVKVPYPYSVRTWNCSNIELLNVHNYSQIKYTTDNPLYDINTNTEVRPTELARLFITGNTSLNAKAAAVNGVQQLAKGFEFAVGLCADSKGNVYFAEQRMKRIYKWNAATQSLQLLADFPWEPLSLGCDSQDNLLVVFRYNPQPGLLINGVPEKFENPADARGTSFSGWGNSGFGTLVYSIHPDAPEESIKLLQQAPMGSIGQVHKALYPSNRWRDFHDFNTVSVNKNETCWVAPDGKTIIPAAYDLARACALVEAFPGKPLYATDEYDKRTVRLQVDAKGYLSDLTYFAEKGDFNSIPDGKGNVWVADGELFQFNAAGRQVNMLKVPERPSSLALSNTGNQLFITGRTGLYRIQL